MGEVLQQQPHARVGVLAAGQVGGAEVGEVDVLERPPGRAGVEAAGGGGEEVGEPADGALDGTGLVAADQALLWIAAGASPKEVAALAGHTSVSFTLDRYGHLYPDSYATLRDRLDALHSSAQERDAEVIDLSSTLARPQHGRNMQ